MSEKILVTSALPYANGPIHLGHLAGAYLPADIFVRYHRLKGSDVIYICGTDEHGVPITIRAEKEGVTPREIVDRFYEDIAASFEKFGMSFDNFSRTSKPIHHKTAQEFLLHLYKEGHLREKSIEQLYCENDRMFLADRYVEGICPHCGAKGARGDQCESCGKWIDQLTLIEPKCKICGSTPIIKKTKHLYLKLGDFQDQLKEWINSKDNWKENVTNFCNNWFAEGLEDRAVTRDLDWGIPVPIEGFENKVMYVWFDAPIGYISSTKEWAINQGNEELWKDYWQNKDCRLIHFIGKDNIVFHAIVFPAVLMSDPRYVLPDNVPAMEFLNLEGHKLSTSRNYAVWLNDYLEKFDADSLRYVLAGNMPESRDTDFSWKDFQARHNNELADILGNFINRTITFTKKYFDGKVPALGKTDEMDEKFLQYLKSAPQRLGELIENYQFKAYIRESMNLAREANKYFNDKEPWKTRKSDMDSCATTLNICLQTVYNLSLLFEPVLPFAARDIWTMLNVGDKHNWSEAASLNLETGHQLGEAKILFTKIEDDAIEAEITRLQRTLDAMKAEKAAEAEAEKEEALIDIDQFKQIKLKVAEIKEAEAVKKSDKLLKLQVDLGGEQRQIIAGIAKQYKPQDLIGKKIIVVANLKPAKLRGELSQGMLLAAQHEESLSLLTVLADMPTGSDIS